eukprot:gnl/TRDRNA2_/TRDRNA2_169265_c0_seq2.p1 gnl/TRDRNA2_/TRDRNA2_169265_c0~~gnl/TRDRNA2_/TRDRNA2_169265_c0_seq2.p1  ORF type:complete len:323 (+),score=19.78 gnl/TRDRNA2_/TRDRNA2_169265_c0_seq2:86-1054(+)
MLDLLRCLLILILAICPAIALRLELIQAELKTMWEGVKETAWHRFRGNEWAPLCVYGGGGDQQRAVFIAANNDRSWGWRTFLPDRVRESHQSLMQCQGPVTPECFPDCLPPLTSDCVPRDCKDFACPCDDAIGFPLWSFGVISEEVVKTCQYNSQRFLQTRVLLIGLGGATIANRILSGCKNGIKLESVEYSQDVLNLAEAFFGFHRVPGRNEIEINDALQAVRTRADQRQLYDIVLVDCCELSGVVPTNCSSVMFIQHVHDILVPGGKLMHNVPKAYAQEGQLDEIYQNYRHVFRDEKISVSKGNRSQLQNNQLLVAERSS